MSDEVTPDNAAKTVARYSISYTGRPQDVYYSLDGEWVKYSAHAATVAALEAEVAAAHAAVESKAGWEWKRRADAAERRVAELEREANSVIEFLSHFASVAANSDDTFAETVMNGVTELTNTIEKERERGLKVQEAAESIDDSWDALMDTQQVIPVSITKLRALREALTGARAK